MGHDSLLPNQSWDQAQTFKTSLGKGPGAVSSYRGSERFHTILVELAELHDRKQADYGRGSDPFANIRASHEFGIEPWVGAMLRLNDKVTRVKSMILNGRLANESLEDSLRDIAVYSIIALVLWEEGRNGKS